MADSLASVAAEVGVPKPDPILIIDGLTRSFGGLQACDVDHLEIQRHAITSLIGPNGAGKTTLFNLLSGFDKPDAGEWHLEGGPLVGIAAFEVARRGLVRTFQLTKSLARLTVRENVMLAAPNQPGERFWKAALGGWKQAEDENRERARPLIEQYGLDHMADQFAGTLSGGQRKLLEMARALMSEPEVVMLDEPTAGVNPALTQSVLGHVTELRDLGMTVIFIEHDMDAVQDISDWVVCMAQGRIIAEGPPAVVAANPAVIDAYLGSKHGEEP
ncbi:MAG: ABC transporter ATP-binding protein [Actinomycetia bacterium]|nr:ABC transporter ATP-binding protein [Actinomycetes bacterium]